MQSGSMVFVRSFFIIVLVSISLQNVVCNTSAGYYKISTYDSLSNRQYCIPHLVTYTNLPTVFTCSKVCNNGIACLFFMLSDSKCIVCYGLPFPDLDQQEGVVYEEYTELISNTQEVYVQLIPFPSKYAFDIEKVDWQTARNKCQRFSGDLMAIETQQELEVVRALIIASDEKSNCSRFWTSGQKSGSTWYWGDDASSLIDIWNYGLPDGDAYGYCANILFYTAASMWTLNDQNCGGQHCLICEFPI